MIEVVRYTYRLRPGAIAERGLLAEWHRCRFVWNEAVHQQATGAKPTLCSLSKLLTEARANSAWLRDGAQVAQQQTLRTYVIALNDSFKVSGRGRPEFKSRKEARPTLEYTSRTFRVRGHRLTLARGLEMPIVWSRDLPSTPTSVRVYRDSLGHWYASFVTRREQSDAPPVSGSIGIDWGVTTTATTTDAAYDLAFQGYRKRCAAELAKAQRRMSRRRRVAGSGGYKRARRQVARLYKKAARQNVHAARVWAKRVVDDHQLIAVEDFKPAFLAKSTMARKAADAAIGTTKNELVRRGVARGREVVLVPPAYTTMTCSACATRAKSRIGLGVRTFRCDHCGYTADRDLNAARTILATAERDRAGMDGVRRPIVSVRAGGRVQPEPLIPSLIQRGGAKEKGAGSDG